jgi:hypothetical protein
MAKRSVEIRRRIGSRLMSGNPSQHSTHESIAVAVDRVVIRSKSIEVYLNESVATDQPQKVISIQWVKSTSHRRRAILAPQIPGDGDRRLIKANAQATLIEAIARARRWMDEINSGKVDGVEAIAVREGRSARSVRMTLSLAFLAPDIVRSAVGGTLAKGIGPSRLADLPVYWVEQRQTLGLCSG